MSTTEHAAWPHGLPRYWPLEGVSVVVTTRGDVPVTPDLRRGRPTRRVAPRPPLVHELLDEQPVEE